MWWYYGRAGCDIDKRASRRVQSDDPDLLKTDADPDRNPTPTIRCVSAWVGGLAVPPAQQSVAVTCGVVVTANVPVVDQGGMGFSTLSGIPSLTCGAGLWSPSYKAREL